MIMHTIEDQMIIAEVYYRTAGYNLLTYGHLIRCLHYSSHRDEAIMRNGVQWRTHSPYWG